jgi:endonuclease/exonuclease/phosphatase family metal-dependent hydrolase
VQLTVLSWNTLFAGRDGEDHSRFQTQLDLITDVRPDIFLMQEAKGLDADGYRSLLAMERKIGMRGFLAPAVRTGQNVVVFIREPIRPVTFDADSVNFHHAVASLTAELPGGKHLTCISAHLCPNAALLRRREAAYLGVKAVPDKYVIIAGDFNSASPHDDEPSDFASLPAHHRARYVGESGTTVDRSVLGSLEGAGWIDVANALGRRDTATVPAAGFRGTEFATMRCDYFLVTPPLAERAISYEVLRSTRTDHASDHYPIVARFEMGA